MGPGLAPSPDWPASVGRRPGRRLPGSRVVRCPRGLPFPLLDQEAVYAQLIAHVEPIADNRRMGPNVPFGVGHVLEQFEAGDAGEARLGGLQQTDRARLGRDGELGRLPRPRMAARLRRGRPARSVGGRPVRVRLRDTDRGRDARRTAPGGLERRGRRHVGGPQRLATARGALVLRKRDHRCDARRGSGGSRHELPRRVRPRAVLPARLPRSLPGRPVHQKAIARTILALPRR